MSGTTPSPSPAGEKETGEAVTTEPETPSTSNAPAAGAPAVDPRLLVREQGFAVLADEHGVRLLREPGTSLLRSRVLGFRVSGERRPVADDRHAAEAWRCRVLLAEVARTVRRGDLVRINVRAKDLRRPHRRAAALAAELPVLA